jgi:hypothetical protein
VLVILPALDDRALFQLGDDLVHPRVEVVRFLRGAGDDQRRAGLVDEDRVHFVDDREVVAALHHRAQ